MRYYLIITPKGFPVIIWAKGGVATSNFCVELERTEAVVLSRAIKRYIDQCMQVWDGDKAFATMPYAIPGEYLTADGECNVDKIRDDMKSGKINLIDKFIYK